MTKKLQLLSREQILGAADVQSRDIECPEWGGTVRIGGLTAKARAFFMKRSAERRLAAEAKAKAEKRDMTDMEKAQSEFEIEMLLVAFSAIDDKGNLLFTDADIAALGRKSAAPMTRCAAAAMELAGLTTQAAEAEVKNSAPASSSDSSSA